MMANQQLNIVMRHLKEKIHWLILVIGVCATTWGSSYISGMLERKAEDAFRLQMQDLETAIVSRLGRYEDVLFGVAGLFLATEHVTPEQFDAYAEALSMKERFPALDVINYAQYFPKNEKENFLRNYKSDTDGRGKEIVLADHDDYMVLTRVYPHSLNQVLGVDVLVTTGIRIGGVYDGKDAKMPQGGSYSYNKPYSSGLPIRTRGKRGPVLAARLGIYKAARLIGTSGIGFEIDTFFKEAVPKKLMDVLHYVVHSTGRESGEQFAKPALVFDSGDTDIKFTGLKKGDLLHGKFDIRFGGAIFTVEATSKKELQGYENYLPQAVLFAGFLFFAGVSFVVRRIMRDNRELDEAVNKRTAELQCEINRSRSLEMELSSVMESERIRIGRELHDDLGQRLTGISVSAAVISKKMEVMSTDLARQVKDLGAATSDAMTQIRALAHGLMPVASDRDGLMEALERLAESTTKTALLHCAFEFDTLIEVADESVAAHLYRIAQEAINNVIRHSHAKSAEIRIHEIDGKIVLRIWDDGRGFDKTLNSGGVGLSTIAQRASIIGYNLSIITAPGEGTTIKVTEC